MNTASSQMNNSADISPEAAMQELRRRLQQTQERFQNEHAELSDWMRNNNVSILSLSERLRHILASAAMAGTIAIQHSVDMQVRDALASIEANAPDDDIYDLTMEEYQSIISKMEAVVAMPAGHLSQDDELYLEQQMSDLLGFEVTAELEGKRLNHSIGIMGGEQHLRRFPTDTLAQHDAYREAGMAPARGAFGWFTEQGELTERATEREKYYFAVQTLYLPDWNENYQNLKPWYKYRKMIVVNPAEELAVVGVVGDAGPAQWVKKQFGGSPEVIREGKIWSPKAKGRVMLMFVDDPEDSIPLGVIDLQELSPSLEEDQVRTARFE